MERAADISNRAAVERAVLGALVALWAGAAALGLARGAMSISLADVFAAWTRPQTVDAAALAIADLRGARVVMGSLTGAALACAGAALQGIFRNPLADPGLIGVTSGASLGAVLAIACGAATLPALAGWSGAVVIAVCAFFGALAMTALAYALATRDGRTSVVTMLLAGIAVNAGAFAAIGYFMYAADNAQLRSITLWTLGSLAGGSAVTNWVAAVVVLVGCAVLMRTARALDLLALGESEAFHLGIDVQRLKRSVVLTSAAMVGCVVAFAGAIGFVGLVVPHIVRLAVGPSHRLLLPASALLGAALLVAADIAARTLAAPAELPIGVLTAAAGTPFFLALLVRGEHRRPA